jgi:drug/metabolite transporter (DMT)-like permease
MMSRQTRGIGLMVLTVLTFAVQDGFSRLLAGEYSTLMVVMIRYWIFGAFVLGVALRRPEGLRAAVRSRHFALHALRAVLLVAEICCIVWSYTLIGLINAHAVFAVCPLLIVALSGPMLGERLDLLGWGAVVLGCLGVLVILQPGAEVFSWPALLPLASALMFALYSVLTRATTRDEPSFPAFFWPPVIGTVLISGLGLAEWQEVAPRDWLFLAVYGGLSILPNYLLQRTYETVEASVVQPFAYLQIAFIAMVGVGFFGEVLQPHVVAGLVVVVAAGLMALALQRKGRAA